ncbi:MAG: DUF4136 domain-containing protein [Spongiibacteraceae bacterium]
MRKFIALLCTALLLSACQTSKPVATDYNPDVDFGSFRQYAWKDDSSGADKEFDPLLAQRVRDAVTDGLAARQFSVAEKSAGADFLVRYYIQTDEATEESKTRGGLSIGGFGSNVGMGVGMSFPIGPKVIEQRAQILIDFINNKDQKLAWRGSRKVVLKGNDPNAMTAQIRTTVDEILGEFPPR